MNERMNLITKKQLAEWARREAAYYADAEKWKRVEERMKRQHDEQIAEWKQKDAELEKIIAWGKAQEEIKKYTQEERLNHDDLWHDDRFLNMDTLLDRRCLLDLLTLHHPVERSGVTVVPHSE